MCHVASRRTARPGRSCPRGLQGARPLRGPLGAMDMKAEVPASVSPTPRAALTWLLVSQIVLFVCCGASQEVLASRDPRAQDSVCCGQDSSRPATLGPGSSGSSGKRDPSAKGLQAHPATGMPSAAGHGPSQCCGKGWGLHCCHGGVCCLDDKLVIKSPMPIFRPSRSTLAPGIRSRPAPAQMGSDPWKWKNWGQWLNLTVVILIVALVCAVLVCCYRSDRRDRADRAFRQQSLLGDPHVYRYGTLAGHTPYWNPPVSRWVDFSQKPNVGPYYKPTTTVRTMSSSDSELDLIPSPIFSSSDEEYKMLTELKRKTLVPG